MHASRGRAWRRSRNHVKSRKKGFTKQKQWSPEKNWKLMYTRGEKLHRARQLGVAYPRRTFLQLLDDELPLNK